MFEIPLSNVSQCTTGKNEVTLEFHQNDDAEVSLMEVRFYVPPTQEDGVDPVEVRGAGGRLGGGSEGPVATVSLAGLRPERAVQGGCDPGHRRRHLHLPGAAVFDPTWALRHPHLPHLPAPARQNLRLQDPLHHRAAPLPAPAQGPAPDVLRGGWGTAQPSPRRAVGMVLGGFVSSPPPLSVSLSLQISLDPPIKQGQTRYHFLILLFSKDEDISLTLNMNE